MKKCKESKKSSKLPSPLKFESFHSLPPSSVKKLIMKSMPLPKYLFFHSARPLFFHPLLRNKNKWHPLWWNRTVKRLGSTKGLIINTILMVRPGTISLGSTVQTFRNMKNSSISTLSHSSYRLLYKKVVCKRVLIWRAKNF